jgi:hypothetical protein
MTKSLKEPLIQIRRVVVEDLETLKRMAQADDHFVFAPTHVTMKNGDYVGFLSIASIPMVLTWQDTNKVKAIDSIQILKYIEGAISQMGSNLICVPCSPNSPYRSYMERFGYNKFGNCDMFAKTI